MKLNEVDIISQLGAEEHLISITKDGSTKRYKRGNLISNSDYSGKAYTIPYTAIDYGYSMMYSSFKIIGSTLNAKETILLVCPITGKNTIENLKGIQGKLFLTRGGDGFALRTCIVDIILLKGYSSIANVMNKLGTFEMESGRCVYNDKEYLALKFPASSAVGISYSGMFTSNCVFQIIESSGITWY